MFRLLRAVLLTVFCHQRRTVLSLLFLPSFLLLMLPSNHHNTAVMRAVTVTVEFLLVPLPEWVL
jgi:hypothetical protein